MQALRAAGADVVAMPMIEIRPLPGATELVERLLGTAAWVVVTSANSLDAFTAPPTVPLAAVGTMTAQHAERRGFDVSLVAPDGTAASLAEAFGEIPRQSGRVLLVQAAAALPGLADAIRSKGWLVDEVAAYETIAAPRLDAKIGALTGASAIVFTSPSTVEHFVATYGLDFLPGAVVAIGPTTADACRRAGMAVAATAIRRTPDGIVEAVAAALSEGDS